METSPVKLGVDVALESFERLVVHAFLFGTSLESLEFGADLILPLGFPLGNSILIRYHILQLLHFQNNRNAQLIELTHLLRLEVLYLVFRLLKLALDLLLGSLQALAFILQGLNEVLDLLLVVVEFQTGLAKFFDFFNFVLLG